MNGKTSSLAVFMAVIAAMGCVVVAAAATDRITTDQVGIGTAMLSANAFEMPAELKEKLAAKMPAIAKCIHAKALGTQSTLVQVGAAYIKCLNNGNDNTKCCMAAGFTDEKCAQQLCDGKVPKVFALSPAEAQKCGSWSDIPGAKKLATGVLKCAMDNY